MIAWLRRTLEDPNTPVFWKIQLFGLFSSIIIIPVILLIGFVWFGGKSQINNWMMSYQRWSKGFNEETIEQYVQRCDILMEQNTSGKYSKTSYADSGLTVKVRYDLKSEFIGNNESLFYKSVLFKLEYCFFLIAYQNYDMSQKSLVICRYFAF